MTQWTQTILGAFGSGASGSSIIRTRLLAPSGTPSHASGGETSSAPQVYFEGMWPFCWNAGEFKLIAMAELSHRNIRAVAERITASSEFRCGDTCFISSLAREHRRLMQKGVVTDLPDKEIRHVGPRDETAGPVARID